MFDFEDQQQINSNRANGSLKSEPISELNIGLKPLHCENRSHSVFLPRRQVDGGVQDVARFDAQKLRPFVLTEIPHLRGFLAPRIPHYRSERIGLCQSNTTPLLGSNSSTGSRVFR